jgi:hypothetical protein
MSSALIPITAKRFVKLKDLTLDHKHWSNPREFTGLDDEDLAELGADIKLRGINDPPKVQQVRATGGGITDLEIDGQRRILAANEVLPPDTLIPVIDNTPEAIELTPEAADKIMLDMLAVVTYREGLSSFELSTIAEKLRSRGRTLSEIGKAIRRDESWVSKMLKARSQATPELLKRWRKSQITDEQFKDLSAVKEPEKQAEATKEAVKLRESGDAAEARLRTKELAESFKKEQKADKVNGVNGAHAKPAKLEPKAVTGQQEDLFDKKPAAPAPKKVPMTSRLALEEMIAMANKRPPTADYVKGLMDGVRYAIGEIGPEDFSKAWKQYLARVDGAASGKKRKPPKKAKRATKKPAKKKSRR